MRKTNLLFLIMLLYFIVRNFCMAQEKNSKNRELTIYMRVKDHLTHDDIDSTFVTTYGSVSFSVSRLVSLKLANFRCIRKATYHETYAMTSLLISPLFAITQIDKMSNLTF